VQKRAIGMRPFSFHVVQETAAELIGGVTPITDENLTSCPARIGSSRESVQVATPFKMPHFESGCSKPANTSSATKVNPQRFRPPSRRAASKRSVESRKLGDHAPVPEL